MVPAISQVEIALRNMDAPTPISTSRSIEPRSFPATHHTRAAVSTEPMIATTGTPSTSRPKAAASPNSPCVPETVMTKTAATEAPLVMPRTSGLARGLRATDWVSAPEKARAAPTARPTTARPRRHRNTMVSSSRVPPPARVRSTSGTLIGKSPRPRFAANTSTVTRIRATATTMRRGRSTAESGPRRTARRPRSARAVPASGIRAPASAVRGWVVWAWVVRVRGMRDALTGPAPSPCGSG